MGPIARRGMPTTVAMKKAKVYRGTTANPNRAPTMTKSRFLATTRDPAFQNAKSPYSSMGLVSSFKAGRPNLAPLDIASRNMNPTAAT